MAINRIAGTTKVNKGGGGIGSLLGKVIGGIAGTFVGQPIAGAAVGGAIGGGIGSAVNKPKQTQLGVGDPVMSQDPINKPSSAIDRLNSIADIGSTIYGMTGSGGGVTQGAKMSSPINNTPSTINVKPMDYTSALQRRGYTYG